MDSIGQRREQTYAFGPYLLIPQRQLLLQSGHPVRIGGRALDILIALVEQPGEILSKQQLIERAWPTSTVGEDNLKVNIASLRRVLDAGLLTKDYIEAVPARGYRFVLPVQVGQVPDSLSPTPPAVLVKNHNLPTSTTRIVGRADTIEVIGRELAMNRLVSIVGPGGIGKTTVGIAVAECETGRFADGVWLVDFSPLRDHDLVPDAIALATGMNMNAADMLAALCEFLRGRDMLLLLDNCEHLSTTIAVCVTRILENAGSVKVIVTSREPLAIDAERVYRLPALPVPPASFALGAAQALAFPAVELFVDRIRDRLHSFALNDADAVVAAQICRRLDGLALAIELAAMRVEAFGVMGVLRQLDDQFRFLRGGRGGLERHNTLMATIGWSYSLLPVAEARFLCALSAFAGSFKLDGASAIAGRSSAETKEVLNGLVAKSLIAIDGAITSPECRYRLLETTREYCLARLRQSADEPEVLFRHASHICMIVENAARDVTERSTSDWSAQYRPYLDDLRVALDWCEQTQDKSALFIRLTVAGNTLWSHFTSASESREALRKAIDRLDAVNLTGSATEMHLQCAFGYATMFTRGIVPVVRDALQRALDIALAIGNAEYQLRALRMIAHYDIFVGDQRSAIERMNSFIAIAEEVDPSAVPTAQATLALVEIGTGRLDTAWRRVDSLWRDRLLADDLSNGGRLPFDETAVGIVLSWSQWLRGFPDTAVETARTNLARTVAFGKEISLSNALVAASLPISYWNGEYGELASQLDALEGHIARHGIVTWAPIAKIFRSVLAVQSNIGTHEAIENLQQAIDDLRAMNHWIRMPFYLGIFASTLYDVNEIGRARSVIRAAMERAEIQHEHWYVPELLRIEAAILVADGDFGVAEANLARAMALASDMGALSWKVRAANDLAGLLTGQSRFLEARQIIEPICMQFTEGFQRPDLLRARGFLKVADRG